MADAGFGRHRASAIFVASPISQSKRGVSGSFMHDAAALRRRIDQDSSEVCHSWIRDHD